MSVENEKFDHNLGIVIELVDVDYWCWLHVTLTKMTRMHY